MRACMAGKVRTEDAPTAGERLAPAVPVGEFGVKDVGWQASRGKRAEHDVDATGGVAYRAGVRLG